ncbi:MFS transporter [Actinosynnema pretiosum]|uniref:MFS transporter n=1 Tax=Actinosynnema pretiosum TaxID=42197 RepID=UPI0015A5FFE1|nr:MFS transporter [Actinosynnema pretiosum]
MRLTGRLSGGGVVLAGGVLVDSLGTGLFLAIVPVFVVLRLGVDPVQVGVVVGVANLIALASPGPAGWLADRFGAGPIWTFLLVGRAIGYSCFLFVSSFWWYALLLCALGLFDRASAPVQQVFLLQAEAPENRSRSMAVLRTGRNIGMSVGLLLGGIVVSVGTEAAFSAGFAVNAASYLVLLTVVRLLVRRRGAAGGAAPGGAAPVPRPEDERERDAVLRDRRYLTLAAGNAVLLLHDSVLFTLLPLWVISRTGLATGWVGPLLAVNTVLTIALQVPLTRWVRTIPAARATVLRALIPLLVATGLFLAAEQVSAALALPVVVLAVVLLTVGENMHTVGAFELSYRLAPERSLGAYLGAFDFGMAVQLAAGPPFMTLVVLRGALGWGALGGAFAAGAALVAAGAAGKARQEASERA